jgi:hypothetical protein
MFNWAMRIEHLMRIPGQGEPDFRAASQAALGEAKHADRPQANRKQHKKRRLGDAVNRRVESQSEGGIICIVSVDPNAVSSWR